MQNPNVGRNAGNKFRVVVLYKFSLLGLVVLFVEDVYLFALLGIAFPRSLKEKPPVGLVREAKLSVFLLLRSNYHISQQLPRKRKITRKTNWRAAL